MSSVKANCSLIEWNDSEELGEVGSFVCRRLKHLSDRVEIPPRSTPSVCFYSRPDPASPEQSLSSLIASLHLSIYTPFLRLSVSSSSSAWSQSPANFSVCVCVVVKVKRICAVEGRS